MVIFDIGHGNDTYRRTGGKGVPGMEEFDFNQQVVKYAKELAEYNGIKILLTQPFDAPEVPLKNRSDYANTTDAKMLISFHANANASPEPNGHWVFYWHSSKNGKRLAEIWDKHANVLPNRSWDITACKPGEWTNFHIVRETNMPAILIEHAFMTNPGDLKLLKDDSFRRQCAVVAAKTICEYLGIEYKEPSQEIDVKEFQRMAGLVPDGIIGTKTREKAAEVKKTCEYILSFQNPIETKNTAEYETQGTTEIAWIDPMALKFAKVNSSGKSLLAKHRNFVNFMFYGTNKAMPGVLTVGTGYSDGKKITTRLPWDEVKRGTFIIHKNGSVTISRMIDPDKLFNDIWFCVQGIGLNPIDLQAEWQPDNVGRSTYRIMLGYNPKKRKVAVTFRPDTDIHRGRQTLINLGCVDEKGNVLGIGGDSGTPATFVRSGEPVRLADSLDNIIYW